MASKFGHPGNWQSSLIFLKLIETDLQAGSSRLETWISSLIETNLFYAKLVAQVEHKIYSWKILQDQDFSSKIPWKNSLKDFLGENDPNQAKHPNLSGSVKKKF